MKAIPKRDALVDEILVNANELANLDDEWIVKFDSTEARQVGSQRVGQDVGIATVVLGTCHRVPVTKSIELFRVDGEDGSAMFNQSLDDRAVRCLDANCHFVQAAECDEFLHECTDACARVRHTLLENDLSIAIKNADLMILRAPVDPNPKSKSCRHLTSFSCGIGYRDASSPLYWCSKHDFPPDVHRSPRSRALVQIRRFGARGRHGAHGSGAEA